MEAIVAVLKPRQAVIPGGDFNAKAYEILLMETQVLEQGKIKKMRQLPATNVLLTDEPSDALCAFLYRYTGAEKGGLRGNQCIRVLPGDGASIHHHRFNYRVLMQVRLSKFPYRYSIRI